MLSVEEILFNHDPRSKSNSALNLRVNYQELVTLPEWRNGACTEPADSPAAYAIDAVAGNTIAIGARFRISAPVAESVTVRAVNADPNDSNPLGDVAPQAVTFDGGESGWIQFAVTGTLGTAVGVTDIAWQWEWNDPTSGTWQPFATTRHRIYVILSMPTKPWRQTPYAAGNTQLPWTQVLDFACRWASGAATHDLAADTITSRIFELGPATFQYNCPNGGATAYTTPGVFNCTQFLDRLNGGPGNGIYVNCKDCASATSTFANIVGCDLVQQKMGFDFNLDPVIAIGSDTWALPCEWTSFAFHEVAWKPPAECADRIFDACLKVNLLTRLRFGPKGLHFPIQPVNIEFSSYRPLLSPSGECVPQHPAIRRTLI